MTDKLTAADRERIAEMAKDWKYNKKGNIIIFTEGAEYEHNYQREQFEQERKDAYDAGLMCERILAKDEIERLKAERADLRNKVIEEAIALFERGSWSAAQITYQLSSLKTK